MNKKNKYLKDYKKRSYDTQISEIEKDLNITLGLKKDMSLGKYLEQEGYRDLAKILKG